MDGNIIQIKQRTVNREYDILFASWYIFNDFKYLWIHAVANYYILLKKLDT